MKTIKKLHWQKCDFMEMLKFAFKSIPITFFTFIGFIVSCIFGEKNTMKHRRMFLFRIFQKLDLQ